MISPIAIALKSLASAFLFLLTTAPVILHGADTTQKNAKDSPDKRPNFILFVTDDMGRHLGALGTAGLETPKLDALAEEGVLFRNAYTSTATCSPSRTSMLSGLYPSEHGVWHNVFPLAPTDNPDRANETVNVLQRHLGKRPIDGFNQLAQWWPAPGRGPKPVALNDRPTLNTVLRDNGYYLGMTQKHHLGYPHRFPFDYYRKWGPYPQAGKWSTPSNYAGMSDFLRHAGDKPFFLFSNLTFTHRPFHEFRGLTGIERTDPAAVEVPPVFPDTPKVRQDIARYYDTIKVMEEHMKEILAALEDSGKLDNTYIIFTSDHGAGFFRHKNTVYEAGIAVPLLISGPSIKGRGVTEEFAEVTDLMPTVLELAGIEPPADLSGVSLVPFLTGEKEGTGKTQVFGLYHQPLPNYSSEYASRSVREGRYKYIRNLTPDREFVSAADMITPGPPWFNLTYGESQKTEGERGKDLIHALENRPAEEFYNLENDPWELNNLLQGDLSPEEQKMVDHLRTSLDEWMLSKNDPGIMLP